MIFFLSKLVITLKNIRSLLYSFKCWRPLLNHNSWNKTIKISDKFFNLNSTRKFSYNVKNQRQEVIKNISESNVNCGKKFSEGKNTNFVKIQNKEKIRFTVQYVIPNKLGRHFRMDFG